MQTFLLANDVEIRFYGRGITYMRPIEEGARMVVALKCNYPILLLPSLSEILMFENRFQSPPAEDHSVVYLRYLQLKEEGFEPRREKIQWTCCILISNQK